MIIYDSTDKKLLEVEVDDNSYRHRVIMGDYNLTLYYALAEHVELPVGAYCMFQGERYTLKRPEAFKMKHSRNFEYTVTMESGQADSKMWKFRNPVDGRLKFSLTAKPIEHLQMFIDNMNRRDTGWQVGECVDGDEVCISYDHAYCYDALSQMASQLNTEFEFDGKTVHLRKVEYNKSNPLPLSYGRGNGFKPNVGRSNYGDTPPVEILFVQGGTDNIDASKYGNTELLLPKLQTIGYDGEHFSDEEGFNEDSARWYTTDDLGYSIRRTDKELTSLAEDSLDCSDIYPKRVGTVSAVIVDEEKGFYDIVDNSIPDSLDYEDYTIGGETMTIIFQSGMLAGDQKEFEVKYIHDAILNDDGTVKKAGRRFEITPQEIDGQTMPNEVYAPKVGDKYAVFHCMLPDAYICDDETKSGASWDMFREGVKYLFDNEDTKFTFSGELDGIWSKKYWLNISGKIKLGGYVKFSDERFQKEGVLVRITGIKDYINKPYSPELELSNNTVGTSFSTKLKELESTEVIVEDYRREALQFTKRRFRDAKETMAMLEEALLDNFTESISPIAIQTMQMLVGDESLQFRFVNSKTNPVQVAHAVTYDAETKKLSAEAGIIQHLTLGISSISSSHETSEYKFWDVEAYESAILEDGTKKYYLYAKVSKTAETGVFLLSETAIKLEDVAGYYHLLVGILNSEYDGARSFATLYSFTEVLPGRITTDRVVSGDGNSYFDMLANAMKLGDALDFNSAGDGKLRLRGTLVQSQSGEESYIGCYRGVYNASYTYYNGDEVSYTYNGETSTYRMINDTPCKGIPPTNSAYWQVVAQGSKGADGTSVDIKGTALGHYNTELPTTILLENGLYLVDKNGSEYSYVANYELSAAGSVSVRYEKAMNGDGYILATDGHLYIATETGWLDVGQIKGDKGDKGDDGATGNYTEFRYAVNGSTTTPPILGKLALNPTGWTTTMPTVGQLQYLWMTQAVKTGDGKSLVTQWSTPVRVTPYNGVDGADGADGEDGEDGRGLSSVTEQYNVSSNRYTAPNVWYTSPPATTSTNKYLWNRERITYTDGTVEWTTPAVIGVHGEDGRGITSVTEMYLATNQSTGVTKNTLGWSSSVQDISASKPYLYNYEIILYTDDTRSETEVTLIGRWGADGADGEDGKDGVSAAGVYRGEYSSTKTYYGNSRRVDIVRYNTVYYIARVDAPNGEAGFTGVVPTNTSYWNQFGASFESVATSLLLAELANIAGFIFRNSRLESQMLSDGTTTDGSTTKTPMIYLNGITGQAAFAGGKVLFNSDGSINIGNGRFTIDKYGNVSMNNVTMSNITANSGTFKGVINASAGMIMNVVRTSATNYTLSNSTTVFITEKQGAMASGYPIITLPSNPNVGQILTIVNNNQYEELRIYGNGHRITPSCGDTMYGSKVWKKGLYLPLAPQRAKQLIFDGTYWWQINGFTDW